MRFQSSRFASRSTREAAARSSHGVVATVAVVRKRIRVAEPADSGVVAAVATIAITATDFPRMTAIALAVAERIV